MFNFKREEVIKKYQYELFFIKLSYMSASYEDLWFHN